MFQILRYLVIGGMTTAVNFGLYTLFTRVFMMEANISNVLAVAAAVLFAYIGNKLVVFQSRSVNLRDLLRESLSFFSARAFTIALDIGGLYLFHTVLGYNDLIVKISLNVIVIVLNYLISKMVVFKRNKA